jgi:hypothetical protein
MIGAPSTPCRPRRAWFTGGRDQSVRPHLKKTIQADEQGVDVATQRRWWRTWQSLRDARQYMFLDECGVTTDLLRRYGRGVAARGPDYARRVRWTDRQCEFSRLLEQVQVPSLRQGDVVVLDNLAADKQPELRAAITHAGTDFPPAAAQPGFESDRTRLREIESVFCVPSDRAVSIRSVSSSWSR